MAVAAEKIHTEVYANSLSMVRLRGALGELALQGVATPELDGVIKHDRADFESALVEMLKTDTETRHLLDVDSQRTHQVVDTKVMTSTGKTMTEVIEAGLLASYEAAEADPALFPQVLRDWYDLDNARGRVEQLQPGQTSVSISMEPKAELAADKDRWEGLGYREGIVYVQSYSRERDGTLVAGSYSVDHSDIATWRTLLAEHGVAVPADESNNSWLRHAITLEMPAAWTHQWVKQLRNRYYQLRGVAGSRLSVSDYVTEQAPLVNAFYEAYYPVLAEALYTGRNHETLQTLAANLLQANISRLKPAIRQQLITLASARTFDDEAGRLVNSLIRYAAVEELRKGLKQELQPAPQYAPQQFNNSFQLQQMIIANIKAGSEANRAYGGCAGQITLSEAAAIEAAHGGPQEAFGKQGEAGGETGPEDDSTIPSIIRCIKCDKKSSKKEVVQKDSWRCPHCKYEVDVCTGAELQQSKPSKKQLRAA